ncbi:MAG: hypothetical protein JOS17DRAFT_362624 [Linnemannia elongata]|nr:MAG: hypothetical protein JOS17DRAFT_362624 [Linnemannia elongata]
MCRHCRPLGSTTRHDDDTHAVSLCTCYNNITPSSAPSFYFSSFPLFLLLLQPPFSLLPVFVFVSYYLRHTHHRPKKKKKEATRVLCLSAVFILLLHALHCTVRQSKEGANKSRCLFSSLSPSLSPVLSLLVYTHNLSYSLPVSLSFFFIFFSFVTPLSRTARTTLSFITDTLDTRHIQLSFFTLLY